MEVSGPGAEAPVWAPAWAPEAPSQGNHWRNLGPHGVPSPLPEERRCHLHPDPGEMRESVEELGHLGQDRIPREEEQ